MRTLAHSANSTATVTVVGFQPEHDIVWGPFTQRQIALSTPNWVKAFEAKTVQGSKAAPKSTRALIEELRSTPGGEGAWRNVVEEKKSSLDRALRSGKIGKIKYYRYLRRLSQKELAKRIETRQSNISRYERPSYKPGRRTLEKLAAALEVQVADLL